MKNKVIIIGIAGGSGSGKTRLVKNILLELSDTKTTSIEVDSYYKDLSHLSFKEREKNNFDHPDSIDFKLLYKHLKEYKLPKVKQKLKNESFKNWNFLCNYKNSISNKKLNINLYYQFSKDIPNNYSWYSIKRNNEFIPSFTKQIFKQVSVLF